MNADERGYKEIILSAFIRVNPRLLVYSLEIVVEHSSMTDQTHLLRQLYMGRPDHGSTPRTDDVVFRLERIDTLTQI